jgi:hypothetical protein
VPAVSKRKENQFLCSSMMLPEHRDQLVERYGKEEEKKQPLPAGEQAGEEVAHCLTLSLLNGLPVEIQVWDGSESRCLQGVVAESRPGEGSFKLRLGKNLQTLALDSILACRLAGEGEPDGPPAG